MKPFFSRIPPGANITGQLPNQTHQDKPIVALSQLLSDHISQSWYVS
jgi:hypothetical protein